MNPETLTLTDGGIETALTDRLGQELPEFAAFVLLETPGGREALRAYYRPFVALAADTGRSLVLDTPTWRANPDWGRLLGYTANDLDRLNAAAVALTREVATGAEKASVTVTVAGCVGPRFDDWVTDERMSADEAATYHGAQVRALVAAGVDRVTAVTMLDAAEATGVVRAAQTAGAPVVVSFTVGADGRLADGSTLRDAIRNLDLATDGYADGVFVNCAHPSEAGLALAEARRQSATDDWVDRLSGFRLNAARHDDSGPGDDPVTFARGVAALRLLAPAARTLGGCCGTDVPHIAALAAELTALEWGED